MTTTLRSPRTYPFLLGGTLNPGTTEFWDIRNPYSGESVGRAALAGKSQVLDAIAAATDSAPAAAALPSHARAAALERVRVGLTEQR